MKAKVNRITRLHFEGDTICPQWLNHLKKENGAPYLLAAILLGNIIYWYKSDPARRLSDEKKVSFKSRFEKSDVLIRKIKEYEKLYNLPGRHIKDALSCLNESGVVKVRSMGNIGLELIPDADMVEFITYGSLPARDIKTEIPEEEKKELYAYDERFTEFLKDVLSHLNKERQRVAPGRKLHGFSYRAWGYRTLIHARFKEGYKLEDFKAVITFKCDEWRGTNQEQYLQPSTLFSPGHFPNYLNQALSYGKKSKSSDEFLDDLMGRG